MTGSLTAKPLIKFDVTTPVNPKSNPTPSPAQKSNSTAKKQTTTAAPPINKEQLTKDFFANIELAKTQGSSVFLAPIINGKARPLPNNKTHDYYHLTYTAEGWISPYYSKAEKQNELFFNGIKAREQAAYGVDRVAYSVNAEPLTRTYDVKDDVIYGMNFDFKSKATYEKTPEEYGIEIGEKIGKNTKGNQFIILGEMHTQTNQWDALIGVIEGLKKSGDKRPVIIVNEMDPNERVGGTYALDMWNSLNPNEHKALAGELGDLYAKGQGFEDAQASSDFYRSRLEDPSKNDVLNWRMVPYAHALNYISYVNPDVKVYDIDVYQRFGGYDDKENRDTEMARAIELLQINNPTAIFVGTMGYHHAIQYMPNVQTYYSFDTNSPDYFSSYTNQNGQTVTPNYVRKVPKEENIHPTAKVNLNTPMAEQLALNYGPWNVHSIRVYNGGKNVYHQHETQLVSLDAQQRPTSESLYTLQFDAIIPSLNSGHGLWKDDEWNPPWKQELDKIKGVAPKAEQIAANPAVQIQAGQ